MTELWLGTTVFAAIVLLLSAVVLGMRRLLLAPRPCVVHVNGRRDIAAHTFENLLPLLNDAGIAVPSACGGGGTCGLCRVTVLEGGGDPSPTELGRLSGADVRAGARLACQVTLRGDLSVRVPDELFGVQQWRCTVRSVRWLAPFIAEVAFDLPAGAEFDFRAGAFVQVTAPPYRLPYSDLDVPSKYASTWDRFGLRDLVAEGKQETTRAYSLANRPSDAGLVLNVRLALPPPGKDVPPGIVSSFLFGVRPGTEVDVSGPYGTFRASDTEREMVFIGGGAGMAPLRAILFEQLERRRSRRKITFWYGARSLEEVFYQEELDALARAHDNFSWTVALSEPKPDDEWTGATGFIHAVARRYLESHPAPDECEYYLCGPPLMTQAVFAMLDELGVDHGDVFHDDFGG